MALYVAGHLLRREIIIYSEDKSLHIGPRTCKPALLLGYCGEKPGSDSQSNEETTNVFHSLCYSPEEVTQLLK